MGSLLEDLLGLQIVVVLAHGILLESVIRLRKRSPAEPDSLDRPGGPVQLSPQ
jgi:hypothetical protein